MQELIQNILFVFQRFNWFSVLDILLVSIVFALLLYLLRYRGGHPAARYFSWCWDHHPHVLVNLPAFSWLVNTFTPAPYLPSR